ncbi:YhcN/YlaJ family sporulation lipoprotein [Bacillaceae bacterium W0354]
MKRLLIFFSILLILTACTLTKPDQEGSLTNSEQTTDIQTKRLTQDEAIRYNMYPNPYEYYEREETEETLDNTNGYRFGSDNGTEQRNEINVQQRNIYYELRQMREIREAGVSIQDDHIYVAVNLSSRTNEEQVIEKVKEVVENITGRTDITVWVDREFHNRIEDRKR